MVLDLPDGAAPDRRARERAASWRSMMSVLSRVSRSRGKGMGVRGLG
jgi:hypothetical protein